MSLLHSLSLFKNITSLILEDIKNITQGLEING